MPEELLDEEELDPPPDDELLELDMVPPPARDAVPRAARISALESRPRSTLGNLACVDKRRHGVRQEISFPADDFPAPWDREGRTAARRGNPAVAFGLPRSGPDPPAAGCDLRVPAGATGDGPRDDFESETPRRVAVPTGRPAGDFPAGGSAPQRLSRRPGTPYDGATAWKSDSAAWG